MSLAGLVLSVLALVVSAHAAVFAAFTGFYRRRIETRIFDNPEPWYVRYAHWIDARIAQVRRVAS